EWAHEILTAVARAAEVYILVVGRTGRPVAELEMAVADDDLPEDTVAAVAGVDHDTGVVVFGRDALAGVAVEYYFHVPGERPGLTFDGEVAPGTRSTTGVKRSRLSAVTQ